MSSDCCAKAPGLCPISFLNNLDVCDLENYKHPPFLFTLWYLALLGKAAYDKVKELLDQEGGDSNGGGGDKGGESKEKKEEEEGEPEQQEEEAPPPAEEEEEEAA